MAIRAPDGANNYEYDDFKHDEQGSIDCGILPFRLGEPGVSLENMENMTRDDSKHSI